MRPGWRPRPPLISAYANENEWRSYRSRNTGHTAGIQTCNVIPSRFTKQPEAAINISYTHRKRLSRYTSCAVSTRSPFGVMVARWSRSTDQHRARLVTGWGTVREFQSRWHHQAVSSALHPSGYAKLVPVIQTGTSC